MSLVFSRSQGGTTCTASDNARNTCSFVAVCGRVWPCVVVSAWSCVVVRCCAWSFVVVSAWSCVVVHGRAPSRPTPSSVLSSY